MIRRVVLAFGWLCGFSCVIAIAHVARAEPLDDGYFAPKLMLGVAGKGKVEATVGGVTGSASDDLELSYGGGLEYMHPLHRYFALGGLVSLSSWQIDSASDANQDRNLLLDIAVVPAGRLPVADDVELYLAVPIGLALDFWGGDGISVGGNVSADVSTGVGFNLGFLLGARFVVTDGFGLLAELGYQLHSFTHEAQLSVLGVNGSQDFDISLGQLAINLGVFFF